MMQKWEKLTRQANNAFTNQKFSDAVQLNQEALALVIADFEQGFQQDPESFVAAAVVSHLNIAEAFTRMGDFLSANSQFECAVKFLDRILHRVDLLNEQREILLGTANHIRFEWELFSQSYGAALASQTKALVNMFTRAATQSQSVVRH